MRSVRLRAGVLLLTLIFLTVILGACNNVSPETTESGTNGQTTGTTEQTTTQQPGGEQFTVTLFNSLGGMKTIVEEHVESFNNTVGKEQGITVEITTNIDKYREVLEVALKAGNSPDLFNIDGVVVQYQNAGWLKAIDDFEGGDALISEYEGMLSPVLHKVGDKTYTLPFQILPIKMVYNKDLFVKAGIVDGNGEALPPETWEDVVSYAKKITEVGDGQAFGYGFTYAWAAGFRRMICKSYIPSVGHFWFDHNTGQYDFSSFAPVFEHLLQMKADGSLFPGAESIQIDPIRAQFAEGRIGMMTAPSYDVAVYNNQFPANIEWGACDLPVEDPNQRYKEPALARARLGLSSSIPAEKEKAVFEVFKYFYADEQLADFVEKGGIFTPKGSVNEIAKTPELKGYEDYASRLEVNYSLLPYPDGLLTLEGQSANEVFERIFIGDLDAAEGLKDLEDRYNDALQIAIDDGKVDLDLYQMDVDLTYNP